jgi:hypothetical protein
VYRRIAARFYFSFVIIDGRVIGCIIGGERENIRGYIRRKILSTLFSNDTDFTAYL